MRGRLFCFEIAIYRNGFLDALFVNQLFQRGDNRHLRRLVRLIVQKLRDRLADSIKIFAAAVVQYYDQVSLFGKTNDRGGEAVDAAVVRDHLNVVVVLFERSIANDPSVGVVLEEGFVHQLFRRGGEQLVGVERLVPVYGEIIPCGSLQIPRYNAFL